MSKLPNIKYRLLSGFGIAGLLFTAFFLMPDVGLPFLLAALAVVLSLEFYRMLSAAEIPNFNCYGTVAVVSLVAVTWLSGVQTQKTLEGTWDAVVMFLITVGIFLRQFPQKNNPKPLLTIAGTLFGVLYVGLLWNFLTKLLVWGRPEQVQGIYMPGRWLLMYVLFAAKFTDIGAYLCGCAFGRHKLIPRISPAKSWEGVLGGMAVATMAGTLLVYGLADVYAPFGLTWQRAIPLGLGLSVCAVVGDLTESLFKRASGVKDSASVIPGMGGLLDVLDSVLFTAPAFYLYLRLVACWG